ncbi:hypothetical protein TanjilG_28405 [Lupinus angustifolius]|uniref:Uncharacterized protein n=1 Tax=Lupinus angustifolius TaxID=3871 RepID=A0A394DCI7_LUPAN|nr:hypothetical protein TanjilG_28405 [Lupinus angustifolius]
MHGNKTQAMFHSYDKMGTKLAPSASRIRFRTGPLTNKFEAPNRYPNSLYPTITHSIIEDKHHRESLNH